MTSTARAEHYGHTAMSTPPASRRATPTAGNRALRNLLWIGHGVNDMHVFLLPLVLPMIVRELALPFSTAGLLVSGFLFAMALSSYFFGRISDRHSAWKILGFGFLVAAACLVGGGLSRGPALLVGFLIVAAVGVGTFHPVAYAQIDRLSQGGSGGAYGVFEFWGGVALIGMYLANGSLLGSIGWQGVLVLTGAPGLALGVLFLRKAGRRGSAPPAQAGTGAGRKPVEASPSSPPQGKPAEGPEGSLWPFALVMGAALLRYLSSMAVVTFTPTYLAIGRGLPTSWSVYLAGMNFLGSMIASPLLGRLADRRDPLWVLILTTGAIAPLMIVFSLPLPVWALAILIPILGASIGGCAPAQNVVLTRFGVRLGRGQIFGIMMGVLSLMASVSPAIYGWLSDHLGLEAALRVLTLPAVAGWALLVILALARGRYSRAQSEKGSRKALFPDSST
ncbi:MAG: MFS transporter [Spirochaetales bacterium]|nr:MFS transporter [Spirochaetales bacterium]